MITTQLQAYVNKQAAKARRERWEAELARHLRLEALDDGVEREFMFHDTRRWRFDFAWPAELLAVEVEGVSGGAGGRHQRMAGYQKDLEKYNSAALAGWRVLRFSQAQVTCGQAVHMIKLARGRA